MTTDRDNPQELPSGLVTFVFTDIEASTRLYKTLGSTAHEVFDRHNALLRAAWHTNNGCEVHTEGDSFFVAFADPTDAVMACIDVRRRIAAATWPTGGAVRVRMGIHTGIAAPRHGDYMALAVHQAARVMNAAHGDQILITDTTANRIGPLAGASLRHLGAFRLRDFDASPILFQIDADGLPVNNTPPRATPASRHNLVAPLTSFIGRNTDVAAVSDLLQPAAAVSIVGPGGIGKTRLATEIGLALAPSWPDGVWMIQLAPLADEELIVDEIAATLGVGTGSKTDRWRDVLDHLGDQTTLVILDNVEHVIDAVATRVPELLRSCPNITVLCTSREPLNFVGEVIYRVQPLDLTLDLTHRDHTTLASVELFIDRASGAAHDLEWTPDERTTVTDICAHLDGMPLAIEIAAAQAGVMTLGEIRAGLGNHRRLLRSRNRSLPNRHRTIEGLLSWSYRLLSDTEQRLFRRLAVFGGSFSIDDAEATLAGDGLDSADVAELVWALFDKSLIIADFSDSATRYRLFESVQQYAMQLLIDNDDPVGIAIALGSRLLDRIAPWRVNDRKWLGDVAVELPNIRAVVDLIGDAEPEMAQQLICSVGRYHDAVQSYRTGVDELTRAAASLPGDSPSRVALLATLADLHLRMANQTAAASILDEASELCDRVGPPLWNDVAIDITRGELANRAGAYGRAITIAEESLARTISPAGAARIWSLLGIARSSDGDLVGGLDALEHALDAYVSLAEASHVGVAHSNVAEAAWRLGDRHKAAQHQRACLDDALAIGQRVVIAYSLIMAARLAGSGSCWTPALQMHACAEALLADAGHEVYDDDREAMGTIVAQAIADLGPAEAASVAVAGSTMAIIDAVALARETFDEWTDLIDATTVRGPATIADSSETAMARADAHSASARNTTDERP